MSIKLINVSKEFNKGKRDERILFENVNITFPANGLVFIKGESGSGKTTLINIISGLDIVSSGTIEYDGLSNKKISNNFGYLFQDNNLIENITVRENLLLHSAIHNSDFDYKACNKLMKNLDVINLLEKKVTELSGGEKQRIALIKAVMTNRDVLIADEPTKSLDYENSVIIMEELLNISQDKLVIIVSHDIKLSEDYANLIIEFKDDTVISKVNAKVKSIENIDCKDYGQADLKFNEKQRDRPFFIHRTKTNLPFLLLTILIIFILTIIFYFRENDQKNLKYRFLYDNDYQESSFIVVKSSEQDEMLSYIEGVPTFKFVSTYVSNVNLSKYYSSYNDMGKKCIELNDDFINKYKVIGSVPKADDEILITKHDFLYFKRFGFKSEDGSFLVIDKEEDIIGKVLYREKAYYQNLEWFYFKIVGVIDTKFDESIVDGIYFSLNDMSPKSKRERFSLRDTIHTVIFVNKGYHARRDSTKESRNFFVYPDEGFNKEQLNLFLNNLDLNEIIWSNEFTYTGLEIVRANQIYYDFYLYMLIGIIVVLLLLELLFANIQFNKDVTNMGILMTLGYKRTSIIKDIILKRVFVYLIITLSTFLISVVLAKIKNHNYSKQFQGTFNYFTFDGIRLVYALAVTFAVIIVLTIFYSIRLFRQNILKIIR